MSGFCKIAWQWAGVVLLTLLGFWALAFDVQGSADLSLTPQEQAYLKANPVIRVASDSQSPPLAFFDEQRQYQGMSADLLQLLQQRLGVEFIVSKPSAWIDVLAAVKRGDISILLCATNTAKKRSYLQFTEPYFSFPAILVGQDNQPFITRYEDLVDQTIAVVEGRGTDSLLLSYPNLKLKRVANTAAGLAAVAKGEVFGFSGNLMVIQHLIQQDDFRNLKIIGHSGQFWDMAIGVRLDEPILFSIIQKTLASIPLEQKQAIFNRWLESKVWQKEMRILGLSKTMLYLAFLSGLVVFFAILLYQYRRQQRLQLRLAEIEMDTAMMHAEHFQKLAEKEAWYRQEQTQFFAMLTHEIKTPLAMIDGAVQSLNLMGPWENAQQSKRLLRIEKGVKRLNRLMENFAQKRNLESQEMVCDFKQTEVNEFLYKVAQDYSEDEVSFQIPEEEVYLAMDEKYMRVAVQNLLDNALKYSASSEKVVLSLVIGPDKVTILVKDFGRTIAEEDRATLFKAYYRSQKVQHIEGSGLGLYLVEKIMHLHRGKIFYLPNEPVGNRFYMELTR